MAIRSSLIPALLIIAATLSLAATRNFSVRQDTALRIRLDDTLTSVDSEVGDPFTATVVDNGEYQKITLPDGQEMLIRITASGMAKT